MLKKSIIINNPEEYLNETTPYIFIDKVHIMDNEAYGYKNFSSDEWFFKDSLLPTPIVPSFILIEAIVQCSAVYIKVKNKKLKTKNIILKNFSEISVQKPVYPQNAIGLNLKIINNSSKEIKVYCIIFSLNKETDKNNLSLMYNKEHNEIYYEGELTLEIV